MHTFIRHGYVEGITNLVQADPSLIMAKSERGRTALHLAVLFGNFDIIELFLTLNNKAVNIPDNVSFEVFCTYFAI